MRYTGLCFHVQFTNWDPTTNSRGLTDYSHEANSVKCVTVFAPPGIRRDRHSKSKWQRRAIADGQGHQTPAKDNRSQCRCFPRFTNPPPPVEEIPSSSAQDSATHLCDIFQVGVHSVLPDRVWSLAYPLSQAFFGTLAECPTSCPPLRSFS